MKAVAFDFDGVIVESVDVKNRAFGELFRDEYPDKVQEVSDFQLANVGLSRLEKFPRIYDEILGVAFPDGELGRLDERFSRIVYDAVVSCPFVAGALDLLERLHAGHRLFVVSATPEWELRRIVESRGLAPYFTAVYGAPAKKVDLLRGILTDEELAPTELLFVGDALNDLHAARARGVPFVGRVPAGEPSPFPPGEPVLVVGDLAELDRGWSDLERSLH